ncbi:hypothetical protein HELRODRAFT_81183 [Helobdella robusta]|uniref:Diacylglycerol kinase n=1 Tax=Helobdella robusta TaxID=6412 RepID=T1G4A8_HELRO|nr:hypothetical protein HELRODRAFT_81183 [Helobdella robusta]ESO02945.1 hypothetical protein HELRODRAFT_81183 [Helobdella robusta]
MDGIAGENNNASVGADVERGYGHFFIKKTFHRPTYCHHCTDMLWGLIGQGYVCEVCNFVVHDRCLRTVVSPCSSIASNMIKNPVAHCWSEPGQFKRKFCNLCRKRLEDSLAIRCEICEYYSHVDCQDFAVSDCKECATYVPNKDLSCVVQYHHWREGNLAGNSKCFHCKKTCWSAECLAGMRCEWCGVTAHATCYKQLPSECSFGCLRDIMLPPYSVTVPRMDVPQEILFGLPKRTGLVCKRNYKSCQIVQLYDGNSSLKRKQHRLTVVPKQAPAQMLLVTALRTFHISDDPNNFSISEATENGEKVLDLTQPLHGQVSMKHGKKTAVLLRYREQDANKGYIRIYPKGLSDISPKADVTFKHIPVQQESSAQELISLALHKFGIENANPSQFTLVEVVLDKGVSERELSEDDKPFLIMQRSRKECLRQSRMTRFYIKQKDDPHGPNIAMYVGNLPTNLSQRQYEHILLDIIGRENKWSKFDVIYYEYGSLVLMYCSTERASRSYKLLQEASFDDKQILVLLLPNIQPLMIQSSTTPLLVLVNVKSGGQQGMELIRSFRKLLNPHQVYDLMNGGPLPGLYVFRNLPRFKILVCGGDGSVGWALSCLDNVGQDALCQSPPMAVIPLGTGNDLARVLRWGPGYTGAEDPLSLLRDVIEAEDIKLDRWTVIFHPNEKDVDDVKVAIANDTNTTQLNEDPTSIFVMNNYFGIGIDADLCLDFHMAREENPDKFNSRLHNKSMYFKIGLRKMVNKRSCKDLHKAIRLEVDGKSVDVPPVEGVIILNILSWASGANLWGPEKEDQFAKPTHYDGMLEVVGLTGVVHMGQIQSGLRSAIRIAQGGHIRIQLLADLPVQVDGEPWIQPAGQVVVLRSALKATMLKKSKNKMKRCNTEPSIYFPNETITQQQQQQQHQQQQQSSRSAVVEASDHSVL